MQQIDASSGQTQAVVRLRRRASSGAAGAGVGDGRRQAGDDVVVVASGRCRRVRHTIHPAVRRISVIRRHRQRTTNPTETEQSAYDSDKDDRVIRLQPIISDDIRSAFLTI